MSFNSRIVTIMVAKDYPKFKRNIKDVNYLENLDTYLSFGTSRAIRNQER